MSKEKVAIKWALQALEPPVRTKKSKDGTEFQVNGSAYWELEGALHDLKRTKADKVCIKTIERVQSQIHKALNALKSASP